VRFVDAYHKEYPGADFSYHSAGGYSGCDVLVEAIKRAGSLDGDKVRAAILKLDYHNIYGGFRSIRMAFKSRIRWSCSSGRTEKR
jgi:ABC-type branched-subunit amino acid transport system substrate-binding protein